MIRDLPKTVPSAVLAAAEKAIAKDIETTKRRLIAKDTYHGIVYRNLAKEARAHVMFDGLLTAAQALVDWGAGLRGALPDELRSRFRKGEGFGTCLSIIRHEIDLTPREGFPGGKLKTELELELDPDQGLFRHHEWFDGFRMNGGGLLNSATGLHLALHPEMLSRIHGLVAEGHNWRHIELGFHRLVDSFKDR